MNTVCDDDVLDKSEGTMFESKFEGRLGVAEPPGFDSAGWPVAPNPGRIW